jgi:hypothetical protein
MLDKYSRGTKLGEEKAGMRVTVPKLDRVQPTFTVKASAQAVRMAHAYGLPLAAAALCQRLLDLEAPVAELEKKTR